MSSTLAFILGFVVGLGAGLAMAWGMRERKP